MTTDPVPQRLSDADRDAAVEMLRSHYEAGRLDEGEFSERMTAALAARYAADLDPLFDDLPDPRPESGAAVSHWPAVPTSQRSEPRRGVPERTSPDAGALDRSRNRDWMGLAQALVWPVAIGMMILGRGGWWWIMAAIVVTVVLGHLRGESRQPPNY